MIRIQIVILFMLSLGLAQSQNVIVNLNMEHSVNGVSELDRNKFFILHHSIDDPDWDSAEQRKSFLTENDVYLGRSTGGISWNFRQTDEDPQKSGWPDIKNIQKRGAESKIAYAKDVAGHQFEDKAKMMVIGGQPMKVYPNGQLTPKGWAYENYDAVAEFYAHYLKEFYGEGGKSGEPRPQYVEVLNEPFVKTRKIGTTTKKLSEFHNVVAKRIKEINPEIKVGGYGAAYPAYEANNFKHWENCWKTFIDVAGKNMDFYSYHLYDNHKAQALPQVKRKGSNIEAIMDMVEHYSVLKHGERKPVYITEFGYFLEEAVYYNKQSDWYQLRAYNSMVMQFMERQDAIIGAIPFMIMKAEWGRNEEGIPYGPRIMRQKKETTEYQGNRDDWVYTDLIKYYQFWKDLKGIRSESRSDNVDILTDTYIDGNKAYVLISNLSAEDRVLNLDIRETEGLALNKVSLSHIHANENDEPIWDKYEFKDHSKVRIGREATMILTYDYNGKIIQNESSKEHKYFADDYFKTIQANTPINVNIKGVEKAKIGEATLRIGMGRAHGLSLEPTVKVNGVGIDVPSNWRGDDQSTRKQFFGVIEMPIPYSLLRKDNDISITFEDEGGHVSSITMQHYSQTVLCTNNTHK